MLDVGMATQLLSVLTLAGDVFLGAVVLVWLYQKIFKREINYVRQVRKLIEENALGLAFFVAVTATTGSLFFSEVAGFTPCKLCWFQRIFMYPQVILLGVAWYRKAREVAFYVIPLSLIGALIAAYHYYVQVRAVVTPCSLNGPDCATKYTFHFGYITIPMMALTAFLLITLFTYIASRFRDQGS